MPRIAIGIEYDGSRFCGWQRQKDGRSVQAELDRALSRVANQPISITGAGRTDAGVHATAQVAHFDTDAQRLPHNWLLGANTHLAKDLSVIWATPVDEDFHARFCAVSRSYTYLIMYRRARSPLRYKRVCWVYEPLDVQRMHRAAQALVGEHDFSSFRAGACQAKSPVRTVSAVSVTLQGDYVVLNIHANAFLQHMVRNVAGSLIRIGQGEAGEQWLGEVLALKDRTQAGMTASPDGLYLVQVRYPERFAIPATGAVCLP